MLQEAHDKPPHHNTGDKQLHEGAANEADKRPITGTHCPVELFPHKHFTKNRPHKWADQQAKGTDNKNEQGAQNCPPNRCFRSAIHLNPEGRRYKINQITQTHQNGLAQKKRRAQSIKTGNHSVQKKAGQNHQGSRQNRQRRAPKHGQPINQWSAPLPPGHHRPSGHIRPDWPEKAGNMIPMAQYACRRQVRGKREHRSDRCLQLT